MSISLLGSINVCKVNTGWANKIQSDRFENPNNMLCPLWNGQDTYGRFVSPDSFYTKAAGCASAEDRVLVENFQRPKYMEFVALDAAGFNAPQFVGYPPASGVVEGYQNGVNMVSPVAQNHALLTGQAQPSQFKLDAMCTYRDGRSLYQNVGSDGTQLSAVVTLRDKGLNGINGGQDNVGCGTWFPQNQCPSTMRMEFYDNQGPVNMAQRQALSAMSNFRSTANRTFSGF